MTIAEIEIDVKAPDDDLTLTMKGKPEDIIKVLVQGLPRDALQQLHVAFEKEMSMRRSLHDG